jgi:hypothetical protein
MKKQNIPLAGFLHAVAATAYIGLVASIMNNGNAWFGQKDGPFTPMAAMMLFVLSFGVMVCLAFVRPVLWYLDGKKKEAIQLLVWMITFFFILTAIVFVCVAIVR